MFEPSETAEVNGVRLYPVDELVGENTNYVPGANLSPKGYVVIATTEYGDAYCVDLNDEMHGHHPLVLMSHGVDWQDLSDCHRQCKTDPLTTI
ncbi:SMI1/KNR4 family protein [Rheinheimera baltica]|uniref:SMI1/KNR4 family protein n=1 Tax=Rheinheimera baltica TaxID=67576 RepID=UPI00041D534B|nr:SMI1/KNR4 family protein [Rheinheimera baltica]